MATPTNPQSRQAVAAWLTAYVAKELKLAPAQLDPAARLFDLGLTSRQLVLLAGDLEDWLGLPLAPDVAWDHSSVEALSALLGQPA